MKKLISVFLLTITLYANNLETEFLNMNNTQYHILSKANTSGAQFDLGETLSAIVWEESRAGKFKIAVDEAAYGVGQMRITTALGLYKMEDTRWNRNVMANRLTFDDDFAIKSSTVFLWELVQKYGWRGALRHYNTGTSKKTVSGDRYVQRIWEKIKVIREHRELIERAIYEM